MKENNLSQVDKNGTNKKHLAIEQIGLMFRTARKLRGLGQVNVAQKLDISQSFLSKIENALVEPDVSIWFGFCDLVQISPESWRTGTIDELKPAILRSESKEAGFKLPHRYAKFRGTKIRSLMPLLSFLRTQVGRENIDQVLREMKVDPDFFSVLDHQISVEFCLDLLRNLHDRKWIDDQCMNQAGQLASQAFCHGRLQKLYDSQSSPKDLMQTWISNASYYDCDFEYELNETKENEFSIRMQPHHHLNHLGEKQGSNVLELYSSYRKSYFKNFIHYKGKFETHLVQVSDSIQNDFNAESVFQVQVA